MRRAIGLLSVALSAVLATASMSHAQAPKEVVIGAIYPLSGNLAQIGIDSITAMRMAVELYNGKSDLNLPGMKKTTEGLPGLGGAKIRLIDVDHQGKPDGGQAEPERLITQEKVTALIGGVFSSVSATTSQVAERYGVPHMNGESSSPTLTERGFKWFFRTSPHDGHFTLAMFEFLKDFEKKKGVKLKTVGLMHEDTLFGADSGKVQEELAKKYGYEVVVNMAYRAKTTSLDAEVGKLKAAAPDVFLPTSYTSDAVLYIKTAKTLEYVPRMLIAQNAGWVDPQFVAEMNKDIEGHITRSPFALDLQAKKPLIRQVNELFKKQKDNPGGRDISEAPARALTAFTVLVDAINRARSTSPEEIRKALVATNVPADQLLMPWTGVRFDEKGQNSGVRAILQQIQMGFVYALIAAGLSLIFGLMEIVNFAHGEFLMGAMFATFWAWALLKLDPLVSLPLTVLLLALFGLLVYHGLIRWILGAPMLAQIFATFGLAIFLRAAAQALWGVDFKLVKGPLADGRLAVGGLFIGLPQLAASVGALAAFGFLYWFITRTETGLALQATAQDRQAAALMGIDTQRMFALGWGVGAACVGAAGALLAMFFYVFPDVGASFALLAYVTVALGGFGNVPATLVAGVVVGVVEVLAGLLIAPAFKYAVVFALYLVVVLWRPQGLFGRF